MTEEDLEKLIALKAERDAAANEQSMALWRLQLNKGTECEAACQQSHDRAMEAYEEAQDALDDELDRWEIAD